MTEEAEDDVDEGDADEPSETPSRGGSSHVGGGREVVSERGGRCRRPRGVETLKAGRANTSSFAPAGGSEEQRRICYCMMSNE